jgi:hypothetical protein
MSGNIFCKFYGFRDIKIARASQSGYGIHMLLTFLFCQWQKAKKLEISKEELN